MNKLLYPKYVSVKAGFWCWGLIYTGVFFLPLYLARLKLFGMPTNVWELWVVFSSAVILYIPVCRRRLVELIKEEKNILFMIALIFAGLIISMMAGKDYPAGLGIIKSWFLFPIWFYVLSKSVVDDDNRPNIFYAYYASSFFVAVMALGYYILGSVTFDGRLQAFFNSPNYLAMYLAPGIIIGIMNAINNRRNGYFTRSARFISLAVLIIALYLTYSYASWAAVSVSLATAIWLNSKTKKGADYLPAGQAGKPALANSRLFFLVLMVLLLGLFFQTKSEKLKDIINLSPRSSLSSRIMIWKSAGRMLEKKWILGIGPGNFQAKYLENQKHYPPYLEWAVPHPHNLSLAVWLYSGIIGAIGMVGVLIIFFKRIIASQNKNPARLIALGIMLYILLHGLIDTTYFKNDLAVVFWLCFLGI